MYIMYLIHDAVKGHACHGHYCLELLSSILQRHTNNRAHYSACPFHPGPNGSQITGRCNSLNINRSDMIIWPLVKSSLGTRIHSISLVTLIGSMTSVPNLHSHWYLNFTHIETVKISSVTSLFLFLWTDRVWPTDSGRLGGWTPHRHFRSKEYHFKLYLCFPG